jgi:dTDP-4-dehydrorhamnose 3,5-epimerase
MSSAVTPMAVEATTIDGLVIITMKQVEDERGVVREFFRASSWADAGLPSLGPWQQMNVTESRRGALRGLHGEDMFKLVAVAAGEAFGAYVDTRAASPTFGNVVSVPLTVGTQVLVPKGVCNGFRSVTDTQYLYTFDAEWQPGMSGTAVNPLDPALAIPWPLPIDVDDPAILSAKDRDQPTFAQATSGTDAR